MVKPQSTENSETEQPKTPEATAPKVPEMVKPKDIEYEGFKFTIDEDVLDDVEVLEMIDGIESGENPTLLISVLKEFIGAEKYDEMKAYFVKKDGRFRMSKLGDIYEAIFEDFDPKDSPS